MISQQLHHVSSRRSPDDALPGGAVQVVLLLNVKTHVVVLIQLEPVHLPVFVPADRLQPHLIRVLVVDGRLELHVLVKLAFAQKLEKEKTQNNLSHKNWRKMFTNNISQKTLRKQSIKNLLKNCKKNSQ